MCDSRRPKLGKFEIYCDFVALETNISWQELKLFCASGYTGGVQEEHYIHLNGEFCVEKAIDSKMDW